MVPRNNNHQHGLVMISMLLLVFMAGTSMFFISMSDRHGDIKNMVNANNEMVSVKEALLAYAVNYADIYPTTATVNLGPGRLPCPDVDRDGDPEPSCDGGTELIYRLPISVQKSGAGDQFYFSNTYTEETGGIDYSQFWYAVSPDFAATNSATYTLNSSTNGLLTMNDESDYVAVIIAPGEAHLDQSRSTNSNKDDRDNYLEAPNNSTSSGEFSSYKANADDDFNDRVIGITRTELMTRVTAMVAAKIKKVLDAHYLGYSHPYAAYQDYICMSQTRCYPRESTPGSSPHPFYLWIYGLPDASNVPRWETVMDGTVDDYGTPAWYEADDWHDVTTYNKISDNEVNIQFTGCAIVYTLRYNAEPEIKRSTNSC